MESASDSQVSQTGPGSVRSHMMVAVMDTERAKQLAAEAAFDRVADGMCLALGTGSTVEAGLPRLAARVRQGLRITCVSSSERTVRAAGTLGLPLVDLDTIERIDCLVDGAD